MHGRLARFYGWTDAEIRGTPWRKTLVYLRTLPHLWAEERMADLEAQHAEKPMDVLNRLRRMLLGAARPAQGQKKQLDSALAEWRLNPFLRGGIEVLPSAEPETPEG
jgi:hypothetical protein